MKIDDSVQDAGQKTKQYMLKICYWILRISIVFLIFFTFIADFNPARISGIAAYRNISLFTSGISFERLTSEFMLGIDNNYVSYSTFIILMLSADLLLISILAVIIGGVLSLGDHKKQKIASYFPLASALGIGLGLGGIYLSYWQFSHPNVPEASIPFVVSYLKPTFPWAIILFGIVAAFLLLISTATFILVRVTKVEKRAIRGLEQKYKLFFYAIPIIILTFLFAYLPLYGWRYAFFEYEAGGALSLENFVGIKWFKYLFENKQSVKNLLNSLRNTLVMSSLGIAVSWFPIAFAVFFSEIGNKTLRKIIQTVTTLPNFISWILIYAVALTLFSSQGFLNSVIFRLTGRESATNLLGQTGPSIWFQMLIWGVWKGTGWSAIIYLAAIAGIDQGLYEAAAIDGARRFKKMWYITIPSLIPTYSVMLLLSFAGILSNGLEQYLVFHNSFNESHIEVLDLYIYRLLFDSGGNSTQMMPFSTVLSMMKSIISVILLFIANWSSKMFRGESII